jgi:hypothetical protein
LSGIRKWSRSKKSLQGGEHDEIVIGVFKGYDGVYELYLLEFFRTQAEHGGRGKLWRFVVLSQEWNALLFIGRRVRVVTVHS